MEPRANRVFEREGYKLCTNEREDVLKRKGGTRERDSANAPRGWESDDRLAT